MNTLKRPITIYIDEKGEPVKIETKDLFHQRRNEGENEGEWMFTFLVDGMKGENDIYLDLDRMWVQRFSDKLLDPCLAEVRTLKSITFKPLVKGGETLEVMRQRAAEVKKWVERYT